MVCDYLSIAGEGMFAGSRHFKYPFAQITICRDGGARSNAADSRSVDLGLREFNTIEQISLPALVHT